MMQNIIWGVTKAWAETPETIRNWIKKTDIPGAYTIKHINTNLFLTSNEKGDIFATVDLNSSFQKWFVFNSSEAETYAYQNVSNGLYFNVSLRDEIYLDQINTNTKRSLINTFQFFPKK